MNLRMIAGLVLATSLGGLVSADTPPLAGISVQTVLPAFELPDSRGRVWTNQDFGDQSILVVAFLGTECPLAKLYSLRLRELADQYADKQVGMIAVMSNRQDSLAEIGAFAQRQELAFPVLKDKANRLADDLSAQRTPEIFVFDAKRTLRYRGRVDDQYGIGYIRDEPTRDDLAAAIEELVAGRDVSVPQTDAVGCIIGRGKETNPDSEVTYSSGVAEILTRRCVECHREGEIGPFSLTDYDEAAGWADMIAEVVRDGRMPPWHATDEHASFANDRSMTKAEKETLYAWADAGAPAGSMVDLPEIPETTAGWQLPREPDHVFPVSPTPVDVPATGTIRYKYFACDPGFEEDVWIQAAELKPGNREVVHHILAFAVPKGQRRGLNGARGFLVGYVPGSRVELPPPGHAKRVPAGSELIFQVHYTPTGYAQVDQSELGIVLADPQTVTHEIVTTSAIQTKLRIPPGESDYQTSAISPGFPANAKLLSFSPHMHVRGKSYRYDLELRDGTKQTLVDIPAYDFNWQTTYVLSEPMDVQQGSRLLCTASFDNSEDNLSNPDPTQTVTWGDQTWDEMMIGYYHYSVPIDRPKAKSAKEIAEALIRQTVRLTKFDELDKDGDGKLAREDTPRLLHRLFDQLDRDGDQTLTRDEAAQEPQP